MKDRKSCEWESQLFRFLYCYADKKILIRQDQCSQSTSTGRIVKHIKGIRFPCFKRGRSCSNSIAVIKRIGAEYVDGIPAGCETGERGYFLEADVGEGAVGIAAVF